jgi:hypothetical protein
MGVHIRCLLAIHYSFVDFRCIQVLVKSIIHQISWYGRNTQDIGMVRDIGCLFHLLIHQVIARLEDRLDFCIRQV